MNFNINKQRFILFTLVSLFLLSLNSCKSGSNETTDSENKIADSLSIKLNSPQLKAINAELVKNPNDPELYNTRATIYISLKQLPEAVNDAKRAIKMDTTKANFYMTLVDAYYTQNNTRLAAFGPTTAKAIRDAGFILDIEAPLPNAPSMTGALELYIKKANNI